jgi:hypothetical protein
MLLTADSVTEALFFLPRSLSSPKECLLIALRYRQPDNLLSARMRAYEVAVGGTRMWSKSR